MNSQPLKTAVKCFGGWSLAAFFVTLLSFIFSFLGTIMCAVLAGMMLGATRQARLFALPTSVIFPGVIFTLLRSTKTDLSSGQVTGLAVVCFGAFWLTFLVAVALVSCERRAPALVGRGATPTAGSGKRAPAAPGPPVPSGLAHLQGRWLCEGAALALEAPRKVLEISRYRLELTLVGGDGRASLLAKGRVLLEAPNKSPGWREPGEDGASDYLVSI